MVQLLDAPLAARAFTRRAPFSLSLLVTCALSACAEGPFSFDATGTSTGGSSTAGSTGTTNSTGGIGGSAGSAAGSAGTMNGGTAGVAGSTAGTAGAGTFTSTNVGDLCPPDPSGPIPPLKLTQVASGLELPLFLTYAPGDPSRLFVIEQNGRVRVIKNGTLLPTPFLDLTSVVHQVAYAGDERGLLGLTFHPGYAQNGRFFLYYTDEALQHTTLVEFHATPGTDTADPASAKTIYVASGLQHGNHNGGMLAFGVDGYLYMAVGDGGKSAAADGNGQNIQSELGKIHRIDPDIFPTAVPGNLQGGYPHIWDWGLRNPWRFSFDRCTGDLYIGDVGQSAWEEVDFEPIGKGLHNYGWPIAEGSYCQAPPMGCDMTGLVPPVAEYSHDGTTCSVVGGYVYRGSKIPNLAGYYLYSDYCGKHVRGFRHDHGTVTDPIDLTDDLQSLSVQAFASFGEDIAGELYVVDLGGFVYRIDPE